MPESKRYVVPTVYILLAVALCCFWAIPYRAAMGYREEIQLFQTTASYFSGLMAVPGGMAVYIGEFFTQFFNNYMIGAPVMAGIMTAFTLLCYSVISREASGAPQSLRIAASFIPLLSLWLTMGNQNVTLAFPVAMILALGAALMHGYAAGSPMRGFVMLLVLASALYWLAGPVAVVFIVPAAANCVKVSEKGGAGSRAAKVSAIAAAGMVWLVLNVWVWSAWISYPFSWQVAGTGYLLNPGVIDWGIVITVILTALTALPVLLLAKTKLKIALPALVAAEAAAALLLYPKAWPEATYRLIDYDYMVRANDWEGILRYSDRHDPDLPLSVSATNLALAMTGQLDARAFDYYQNGSGGLIPSFRKESVSSWLTGEIFFQLGLVNSAQRFYFEGMEAIPNFNKSARAMKRLAETAMLRGDYGVAEKYLRILQNTMFYGKWASRTLAMLRNPQDIDNHPLYGALRRRMIDDDALFSDGNLDGLLARLFTHDPGNDAARQYLIVYPLMERDLAGFAGNMALLAGQRPEYNPPLAQQAVAFMAMKSGRQLPANAVSPAVEQSLRGFAQAWTSKNEALIDGYRRTLFYYLLSDE